MITRQRNGLTLWEWTLLLMWLAFFAGYVAVYSCTTERVGEYYDHIQRSE